MLIGRAALIIGLLAVLAALGVLDLPWSSVDFQVSASTVVLYFLWSLAESPRGSSELTMSGLAMYVVMLVSAIDSFLLELTRFRSPMVLRWCGAAVFLIGAAMRVASLYRSRDLTQLRLGRMLQLVGMPLGLGSLAGLAVGLLPGIPAAMSETREEDEKE